MDWNPKTYNILEVFEKGIQIINYIWGYFENFLGYQGKAQIGGLIGGSRATTPRKGIGLLGEVGL